MSRFLLLLFLVLHVDGGKHADELDVRAGCAFLVASALASM